MAKTIRRIEAQIPITTRKKRVAAYARVSLDTERLENSLSAQISYYSAFIQRNPAWEYAGVSQITASAAPAQTERNSSA